MQNLMKKSNEEFQHIIETANKVFKDNFNQDAWFGRCIFLSWYCSVATCDFCFRSTVKDKIKHSADARRSTASILADAFIGKKLGWRLEFLTGGYSILPFSEIIDIVKKVSQIRGEKIWVNLGALSRGSMEKLSPYVKGVCASVETINPALRKKVCPDKPMKPYSAMLKKADELGFEKSMTMIIGLGESKTDFEMLAEFISEHKLDRITFYALKPVQGTPYEKSPEPEEYAWWISKTRIRFPRLEIIAGLTPKRAQDYVELILKAGANAITKFPAVKKFGSEQANQIEKQAASAGRNLHGRLTELPDIDWDSELQQLPFDDALKTLMREKLLQYLKQMKAHGQRTKNELIETIEPYELNSKELNSKSLEQGENEDIISRA